jgi:hypothetical protein
MRSNKEILEVLLDNVERIRTTYGLCILAGELHIQGVITWEELRKIRVYIKNNRPSALSSIDALLAVNSLYHWPKYKVKPRAKWLKKHIKKLS